MKGCVEGGGRRVSVVVDQWRAVGASGGPAAVSKAGAGRAVITAGFGTDRLPAARRRPGAPGRTRTPRARRGPRSTGSRGAAPPGTPRAKRGALPKARVRLPDPRHGGPGIGQAQTRGRRRARVLLRPRLLHQAHRRRSGLRVLQAMEGAGHPPRTNPPSSTQRASSSTQSSPGALMRRALAAVSSRCSPHGDRRGRRAVLLEWTGGGR